MAQNTRKSDLRRRRATKSRAELNATSSSRVEQAKACEEVWIGVRLRHARLNSGLKLRELANACGCTESFISKLENDKVKPSLAMLHRLVAELDINIATLFSDDERRNGPVSIMRLGERPIIRTSQPRASKGVVLERLIAHAKGVLLEANIHRIAPGASSDGVIAHQGEELGFVLEGDIELVVAGNPYRIRAGDSFFFPSHLEHGYRNPGRRKAAVLWVNTPPTF